MTDFPLLAQRLAAVASSITSEDAASIPRFVEGSKLFLKTLAAKLLQDHPRCPALLQVGCDTTPVATRKRYTHASGEVVLRSHAPQTLDLFVQHLHITLDAGPTELHHAIVFKEPLCLRHGKTMPALLACALKAPGITLACAPREAITLHNQVHDRGVTSKFAAALAGHWQQTTSEAAELSRGDADGGTDPNLLHWHSHCGCALHDAHNALKWAHETLFGQDQSLQKALYAAMASFRLCLLPTIGCLGTWLTKVVDVIPDHQPFDADTMLQIYVTLGAPESLIDVLVHQVRLRWVPQSQRLEVAASFLALQDSLEKLSNLLMCLWRFHTFTSSRWCTIGKACRSFALSKATGFMSLFVHAKQHGVLSRVVTAGRGLLLHSWTDCLPP